MIINIKDFYLMTPMSRYEYFQMKLNLFPEDIIEEYKLWDIVDSNGNVFCEVLCSMYGFPQAGIIVQELLEKHLYIAGYSQSKLTPRYWTHSWRLISFTLVIDNLGVQYINRRDDIEHLLKVLKMDCTCNIDWDGTRYLGATLADTSSPLSKEEKSSSNRSLGHSFIMAMPLTQLLRSF